MNFNKLISEKLHSLFTEHGLEVTEQLRNIVRYESKRLHVSLAYNERENSNNFWLGSKLSNDFVEMDDQVMKGFFNSGLKLKNLSQENFVNNVFKFFTNEGKEILLGSKSQLNELENFDQSRSELYTSKLIEERSLEAANKGWKEGNYLDVIKHLKSVNEENLPASYKQKYKIAQKRLSN